MVRLKFAELLPTARKNEKFQFQHGAVKVRTVANEDSRCVVFQFQHGAVKVARILTR